MAWTYLFIASLFEIAFAIGLKYTDGFTRLVPSVLTVMAATASFVILSQSLNRLPIGTAYAIWTGIGATGTTLIGMYLFDEPRDVLRLLCVLLIVAGVIGLKFVSPAD